MFPEKFNLFIHMYTIFFLAVLFVFSQVVILTYLAQLTISDVFLLQTTVSPTFFKTTVETWINQNMLDVYLAHYKFDFVHPFIYSAFLGSIMLKIFSHNLISSRHYFLLAIPFVAGCLDIIENVCHVYMIGLHAFPNELVVLSGLSARIKWLLTLCSLLFIMIRISFYFLKKEENESIRKKGTK